MPSSHLFRRNPRQRPNRSSAQHTLAERGQSAVILALMFISLLAFVGLATDAGIIYMSFGQLRRAADAAALSAASQLREARPINQITEAATQYVRLQNIQVGAGDVVVETCADSVPTFGEIPDSKTHGKVLLDPSICTFPVRKLVRVTVTTNVQLAFMQLFGWRDPIPLTTYAVSEAASLEVILVIDTSYSMVYDSSGSNGVDDDHDGCVDETAGQGCDANNLNDNWLRQVVDLVPSAGDGDGVDLRPNCNLVTAQGNPTIGDPMSGGSGLYGFTYGSPAQSYLPTEYIPSDVGTIASPIHACRPFEWVRDAAVRFVSTYVKFPYDRVGIVTFAQQSTNPATNGMGLIQSVGSTNSTSVTATVNALKAIDVSVPPYCEDPDTDGNPNNDWYNTLPGALGACYSTDTGDGLKIAKEDLDLYSRQNALRFVIFLSDGAATGSLPTAAQAWGAPGKYACPNNLTNDPDYFFYRPCSADGNSSLSTRHANTDINYDADDYARDQADVFVDPDKPTILFTIGLGAEVTQNPGVGSDTSCPAAQCNSDSLPSGEQLLRYIADQGDGSVGSECSRDANWLYQATIGTSCGNYFYAQGGANLAAIFTQIADEIFTRITE
ncbi:MAG: VWA domain-containing protein [Chloroflexi bacterium]|nr:VWA domain-containing protein [Chloroflexota bacterium]